MVIGHGNDKYQYKDIEVDFSSNIPGGIDHEDLFAYLSQTLRQVEDYPSPDAAPLAEALAFRLMIQKDEIAVTNGATEAIYLTAQAFRGSRSAILIPTFSEYEDACILHGHTVKHIFSLEEMPSDVQMVWMCNPNNPTGSVVPRDTLLPFIEKHADVLFVIDQSYESLTPYPLLTASEANALPNVILIHSMTKEYAIPGLRIGYLTANASLMRQIASQRMPWSVNQVAINAGLFLLRQYDESPFCLEELLEERAYMAGQLAAMGGFEPWPSETNFLLVQLRTGKAPALKRWLAEEHHLLIRDASNFAGLDDRFFRIAVQEPEENERLLDALEEWIQL